MAAPVALRHLHLKQVAPFSLPQRIQSGLANQFLAYKAAISSPSTSTQLVPIPLPTILSFVPTPVYTTGRREHDLLKPEQISALHKPFTPLKRTSANPHQHPEYASVLATQRGGQTTFHGPGQLVIYPILDLKACFPLWPKGLSVRCYVNLLEQATIDTLDKWHLKCIRTENPGVWDETGERKIAALGVHLRRNVTSYGVGINVNTDLRWFERIVACGLTGKGVTSIEQLMEEKGLVVERADAKSKRSGTGRRLPQDTARVAELNASPSSNVDSDTMTKNVLKLEPRLSTVAWLWAKNFAKLLYGEYDPAHITKLHRVSDLGLGEEEDDALYREYEVYMRHAGYLPRIRMQKSGPSLDEGSQRGKMDRKDSSRLRYVRFGPHSDLREALRSKE